MADCGGKTVGPYATPGPDDCIVGCEAPDNETRA
jgi:uncharacterized protein with GYD domain